MYTEIKNRFNGNMIIKGDYDSIKDALQQNSVADLSGADLSGADLRGADLSGADLSGVFIFICGSRHNLQYNSEIGELRIGCHVYHLEYWLIMYDTIGREEKYTEEQIKEYHNYMKMLKNYL